MRMKETNVFFVSTVLRWYKMLPCFALYFFLICSRPVGVSYYELFYFYFSFHKNSETLLSKTDLHK